MTMERNSALMLAGSLFVSIMIAGWCSPTAHAQVAAAFADKVSVDSAYVTGAAQATDIAFAEDGRALITRKTGQIVLRQSNGIAVTLAYPFGGTLDSSSEKGLLGVVADPNVATNGWFYFFVSNGPTADKNRVYRATLTALNTLTDITLIVGAAQGVGPGLEGPANHDGGGLIIHNNQLYVSVGDTGANASPPVNKYGSCLNKGNGKILRVNLDGSLPSDNPLIGLGSVTACASPTGVWSTAAPDPRVYAWGFRNPWRFWVDPLTGLLWVGDVGEGEQEEISIGSGDQHYGYPFVEGTKVWGNVDGKNCDLGMVPSRPCTAPAFSYGHAQGRAVSGGLVLDSPIWLNVFSSAHYIYGDSSNHWLRVLPVNAARNGFSSGIASTFATFANGRPVSLRQGPDSALYVVYLGLGAVYRFAPNAPPCIDCEPTQVPALPILGLLALTLTLIALFAVKIKA